MDDRDLKTLMFKWLIGTMNTMMLALIGFLFVLSFVYPHLGTRFIIFAAIALLCIGLLLVSLHFLERKNEKYQFVLSGVHRYLAVTVKYLLTLAGGAAFLTSFVLFLLSGTMHYVLNGGCFIAFTMVIILIELFIRIILPLTGVEQDP